MVQAGVEPATLALLAPRSNRLSYKTFRTSSPPFPINSNEPSAYSSPAYLRDSAGHSFVLLGHLADPRVELEEHVLQVLHAVGVVDLLLQNDPVVVVDFDVAAILPALADLDLVVNVLPQDRLLVRLLLVAEEQPVAVPVDHEVDHDRVPLLAEPVGEGEQALEGEVAEVHAVRGEPDPERDRAGDPVVFEWEELRGQGALGLERAGCCRDEQG